MLLYSDAHNGIIFWPASGNRYHEISPENVPENIRKMFEEKLNDPLTEIEWLKWKAR